MHIQAGFIAGFDQSGDNHSKLNLYTQRVLKIQLPSWSKYCRANANSISSSILRSCLDQIASPFNIGVGVEKGSWPVVACALCDAGHRQALYQSRLPESTAPPNFEARLGQMTRRQLLRFLHQPLLPTIGELDLLKV